MLKRSLFLFLLFVLLTINANFAAAGSFFFEENLGQWDEKIKFKVPLNGVNTYFEKDGFTFHFLNKEDVNKLGHRAYHEGDARILNQHCVKIKFENANPVSAVHGENAAGFIHNYFIGSDPSAWRTKVRSYESISYPGIYEGIDAKIVFAENYLQYNFILRPDASVENIKMNYSGTDKLYIENDILILKTSLGQISQTKPIAWQWINGKKKEIKIEFVLNNNTVSFHVKGKYDKEFQLFIDPTLIVSTYTGSPANNWGFTGTYDDAGNIYTGGVALETGYPVTSGAFQTTFGGGGSGGAGNPFDIVITKFNPAGTAQIYSTYIGGSNNELPNSLVVNKKNELVILGTTFSNNFPVTAGAYDLSYNGQGDITLSKLNIDGSQMLASTYVGGTGLDGTNITSNELDEFSLKQNYGDDARGEVIVDTLGNVYVASSTQSPNFPTTTGAFQTTFGGATQDGIVLKTDSSLSTLMWSSFLGGSNEDASYSLDLDHSNNVYVAGGTISANFPVTSGALITVYSGGIADGYVAKISASGSTILNATFIGTNLYDQCYFVKLDKNAEVYLYGQTSGAYPVTGGVYSNPNSSQFIHKLNNSLSATVFSTVFGNGSNVPNISPTAFMVDNCQNIYASGWGRCLNFGTPPSGNNNGMPTTLNAFQPATDGCDFYFIVLNSNASSLWYATYFGGNGLQEHVDGGTSRFDPKGVIYQSVCAGCWASDAFPTTTGAWSNHNGSSGCNNAIVKFDFDLHPLTAIAAPASTITGCNPWSIFFQNYSSNAEHYFWNFDDGTAVDTNMTPVHQFVNAGTYNVQLVSTNATSCNLADTSYVPVTIQQNFNVQLGSDSLFCGAPNLVLDAGVSGPQYSYLWSNGDTLQQITAGSSGTFWVSVFNGGCTHGDTVVLSEIVAPSFPNDTSLCTGSSLVLDAGSPGAHYLWSTGDTTQQITVSASGNYSLVLSFGACQFSDTVVLTIKPMPVAALSNDTTMCGNASLTLDAGNPGAIYFWSTGETTRNITVSSTGNYSVQTDLNGCKVSDFISVSIHPFPLTALPDHAEICQWDTVMLNAGNSGNSYQWSSGESTQTIAASIPGTYIVSVNSFGCVTSDSVIVSKLDPPQLGTDTVVCGQQPMELSVKNQNASYLWSTGETSKSISISGSGKYWVKVQTTGCAKSDSINIEMISDADSLYIPNILTPNGDSKNDAFTMDGAPMKSSDLQIFNRWGKLVFENTDIKSPWDGKYQGGADAPDGVYYWILKYDPKCPSKETEGHSRHGFVTLSR